MLSQFTLKYDCHGRRNNVTVKVRMYEDDPVIEFDVRTDEIDVSDGKGKDVSLRFYTSDVDNQGEFYTDSNGLAMQKRITKNVTS